MRTIVLVMLVQFHTEVTVQARLGQATGKSLIGIEHFFHTRIDVHVQYVGAQLFKRQMNTRRTRNTVPIKTILLPTTGSKSHHFIGFACQYLHTAMRQITTVKIGRKIMLGSPQIAGMSTYDSRPIIPALYRNTTVA